MRGENPFEKMVGRKPAVASGSPPREPKVDQEVLPVEPPEAPKPDPLDQLITGDAYEELLQLEERVAGKPEKLAQQDAIDDDRFEHLHGDDWKQLDDHEDRIRAARAIARREGNRADEVNADEKVDYYEYREDKERLHQAVKTLLLLFVALGFLAGLLQHGIVGALSTGLAFFFGGVLVLWLYNLFSGMTNVRGRAV